MTKALHLAEMVRPTDECTVRRGGFYGERGRDRHSRGWGIAMPAQTQVLFRIDKLPY